MYRFPIRSMFEADPAAREMFPGRGDMADVEFKAHMSRVMEGVDLTINSLWDDALHASVMRHLNEQHLTRVGVTASAMAVGRLSI